MAIQTTWDLQPQARPAPVSSDPSITMSPAQTQQRIAQMNRETLAQASPVGRATEEARMAGRITSEQGNAIREYSQGYRETPFSPPSQEPVFTSNAARQDLTNIRTMIDRMSQGIASQAEMNRLNEVQRQQGATNAPPTADDISRSLAERYGDSSATDSFGAAPVSGGTAPPATQDSFTERLSRTTENSLNQQADAYNEWKSSMDQLRRGTIPLTPEQTAQVDAINAAAQRAIAQQEIANKNYTGGMTQLGIRTGMNVYSPDVAFGYIKQATDQGISKIQDIEQKAIESVAKLKEGFREQNYKLINDQYEKLTGLLDKRQSTITDLLKTINQHEKDTRDYNLNVDKFKEDQFQSDIRNTMESDKFNYQQKQDAFRNLMESDKFSYEQKQDNIKNLLDSRKIEWSEKMDALNYNMNSDKFSWQKEQDVLDNVMKSDQLSWNQKMDKLNYDLNSGKFNYQQTKDLEDRKLELAKLGATDNQRNRDEWMAAGQPGTYTDFLATKIDIASGKPPTADQEKNAGFSLRIKSSNDTINSLEKRFKDLGLLNQYGNKYSPNFLKSPDMQRMDQAQRDFVNSVLRRESGAAISPSEFSSAEKQYFPQPGDSSEVMAQKRENRMNALRGIVNSSGSAISPEFKDAALSGRRAYTSVSDILSDHPDKEAEIENALKNGANYNEVLKFYSDAPDSDSKTKPLSMGKNGSNSIASLSEKYESSGDPGSIGYDSTGGFSYGAYQLAHNNAQKFVNQSEYAEDFKGIPFNSEAFKNKWKDVAKKDPKGFKNAQREFVEDTHSAPQFKKLADIGIPESRISPTLKSVIFSTAVQHGPNNNIITNAIKKYGLDDPAELINGIYKERWSEGKRFANSTPAVKKAVYNRFFGKNGELKTALSKLTA